MKLFCVKSLFECFSVKVNGAEKLTATFGLSLIFLRKSVVTKETDQRQPSENVSPRPCSCLVPVSFNDDNASEITHRTSTLHFLIHTHEHSLNTT